MEETVTISKKAYDDAIEAMEHVLKIFRSMSDRGAYPKELCPFKLGPFIPGEDVNKEEPLFLGKQGFMFLIEAVRDLKKETSYSGIERVPQEWGHEEKSMLRNIMRTKAIQTTALMEFEFTEVKKYNIMLHEQLNRLADKVKMNGIGE